MTWLNEYEVARAVDLFVGDPDLPYLGAAALTLESLVDWTNSHSDGWPYWRKPSNASKQLQTLVDNGLRRHRSLDEEADITQAQLRAALVPIKAFRTRQGADFDIILKVEVVRQCFECERTFDLADPADAEEWHYGHDCEV